MFEKFFEIFKSKSKPSNVVKAQQIQKINEIQHSEYYLPKDECFIIDFLYIKENDTTVKGAEITFPANNQYIIVNRDKTFFNAYYINEEGLSSDELYYRISTPDFRFWITLHDYNRFKTLVYHRQKIKNENKKIREERTRIDNSTAIKYDQIDNDIYNCFIAHKSGMCDAIGSWEDFYKVEERITDMCKYNNGKYFKSPAKTAKFAIIFSYADRTYSSVNSLQKKGYKVTTFENALRYFGLTDMWDIDKLTAKEREHKEFMKNYRNY